MTYKNLLTELADQKERLAALERQREKTRARIESLTALLGNASCPSAVLRLSIVDETLRPGSNLT